jgi:hypothetical protein
LTAGKSARRQRLAGLRGDGTRGSRAEQAAPDAARKNWRLLNCMVIPTS